MGETGEMKTLLSDAPETRVNAHWVVSGCTSLLNVYLKMCIFSFVSGLFSCSLLRRPCKLLQRAPLPHTFQRKKKRKEKKNQLSDLQVQNGSHHLTFFRTAVAHLSSITPGKHTVQGQMLSGMSLGELARILLLLAFFLCLFTVVLLVLLDQEFLRRPPELPALYLPVCGLHHYGGEAVLQFTAAFKV